MIDVLFTKNYARLCLYATSILGDPDSAEDVVQTVFLKIINSSDNRIKVEDITVPYLYRSVKNSCLHLIRKNAYHLKYLEEKVENESEEAYDEKIIKAELTVLLLNLLEDLPEGCSRILRMSYIDGLKNSEIAEQLHISINTVKSQKMRGIKLLKERVSTNFLIALLFFLKNL
ncbi:RNA polymerase sigma factor [Sphingobacterium chuzhouense]|uniref:Sigma-70 family RNA polymerase sigma factor n=1 Tax=Sphingobacterium chuzhouense TaxID=1742264 RepID=A0ABR7XNS2_9SPHI|nr:sigma-70 family RNA polymerase sigma factor [Sphingobacterium chuzhouense]MBD1420823.1 sigma-70 family RNA polymerase sigma factor [Sphingobacterium chuzhouense]